MKRLLVLIFLCSFLVSAMAGSNFETQVTQGNYLAAVDAYYAQINGNARQEREAREFMVSLLQNTLSGFASGSTEDGDALDVLTTVSKVNEGLHIISDEITDAFDDYQAISASRKFYSDGQAQMLTGVYENALISFLQVSSLDLKNYAAAQDLIIKANDLRIEAKIKELNLLLTDEEYEAALYTAFDAGFQADAKGRSFILSTLQQWQDSEQQLPKTEDEKQAWKLTMSELEHLSQQFEQDRELYSALRTTYTKLLQKSLEGLAQMNDYAAVILLWNTYEATVAGAPELVQSMASYTQLYRSQVIDASITAYEAADPKPARNIIKEGLKVLPEDSLLTQWSALYKSCYPVSMEDLPRIDGNFADYSSGNYPTQDYKGNVYTKYFDFVSYTENSQRGTTVGFVDLYLGKEYDRFTGIYFMPSGINRDYTIRFRAIVDGERVLDSGEINIATPPASFDLSVTDAEKIRFRADSKDYTFLGTNPRIHLANGFAQRVLTQEDFDGMPR